MITLERARAHLGIDWEQSADQDALVGAYLAGAVAAVERRAQTLLTERAVEQRIDRLVDRRGRSAVRLAWAPVVSVEGIDYFDADGVEQTLSVSGSEFRLVAGIPGLLLPPLDAAWPSFPAEPGAARIRYTAGYGGAELGDAPGDLVAAVLMMVGHLYHNREAVVTGAAATEVPMGVAALCDAHRHTLI